LDARNLPAELPASETDPVAQAARKRMEVLMRQVLNLKAPGNSPSPK
jgi:hypothetical protein